MTGNTAVNIAAFQIFNGRHSENVIKVKSVSRYLLMNLVRYDISLAPHHQSQSTIMPNPNTSGDLFLKRLES